MPVTLSTLLTPRDQALLIDDSRARVLVVHETLAPALEAQRAQLRQLRHVLVAGGARSSFAAAVAGASDELDPEPTRPDDMCFWQYSSGTTGRPKAVVHLQQSALAPAELHGRHVVAMRPDDRVFSVAKLFFSYGLNNSLVIPSRDRVRDPRPGAPDRFLRRADELWRDARARRRAGHELDPRLRLGR